MVIDGEFYIERENSIEIGIGKLYSLYEIQSFRICGFRIMVEF